MVGTDPGEYKSDKSKGLTYKNMLYFIGTERPWELKKSFHVTMSGENEI